MELINQIEQLWGRTLSPIELQTIVNLTEQFNEEVLLESAMMSQDKERPLAYMKAILREVKFPTSEIKKKEEPTSSGSKWLQDFKQQFK
ncbi:MAG: DnaD domain protein [Methanobrevibacter sp.]|nr:DnaD domain protein [Methanobrevibacter sp.]